MNPGERGAIKLTRLHGDTLLCVRYRENPDRTERITTIELVVERAVIQKRSDTVVAFKIKPEERDLQRRALALGARYDSTTKLWKLARREVLRLGLRHRIAMPMEEILQGENLP